MNFFGFGRGDGDISAPHFEGALSCAFLVTFDFASSHAENFFGTYERQVVVVTIYRFLIQQAGLWTKN